MIASRLCNSDVTIIFFGTLMKPFYCFSLLKSMKRTIATIMELVLPCLNSSLGYYVKSILKSPLDFFKFMSSLKRTIPLELANYSTKIMRKWDLQYLFAH